jgi:hypothetical protein
LLFSLGLKRGCHPPGSSLLSQHTGRPLKGKTHLRESRRNGSPEWGTKCSSIRPSGDKLSQKKNGALGAIIQMSNSQFRGQNLTTGRELLAQPVQSGQLA